jgi:CRP/FNR family transcriptional regulator
MCYPTWVGRSVCRTSNILHEVLFSDRSPGELDHIIQGIYAPIDELSYEKGAVIYQHGCDDNAIYTVRSGLVKLARHLPDGRALINRLMRAAVFLNVFKYGFSYPGCNYEL